MLVGRDPERQRLAQLVAAARLGQSGVLMLRGEAGIGKTALLDDTAARAGDMTVMRTSGSERESALGFSALHQLLLPALHLVDRIPGPQSDALAVALTLRRGPTPERFAVGAATLSLLSRYAEEAPLMVVVDDAHLLDPPSAETLGFVARRLLADPIALLMSIRPEPDAVLADAGLPVLELGGLDLASTAELVAATCSESASTEITAKLHRATAGNPLAIVELSLDIRGLDMVPPEAPIPVPQKVARAFGRRIAELPEMTRIALLIAVIADGDLAVTAGAANAVGSGVHHLAAAEATGLLRLDAGRVEFRHPLVRSAVYVASDAQSCREAHRAVAAALPPAAQDRRAWHLSEACVGPDDAVARDLLGVAERAQARGAHGIAAIALARSAVLSPEHASRGARLTKAGESAWLAGQVKRANELLGQAGDLVSDSGARAEIDGLRGNISLRAGSLRDAYDLLTQAADCVEASDPDKAVQMLADGVQACFCMCDTAAGLSIANRLEALLEACRTTAARIRGMMAIGIARVLAGQEGVQWIRMALEALSAEPGALEDPRRPDWMLIGTLFLRESAAGRDLVRRAVEETRARTAIGALPNLLFHTARDEATTERWQSAQASYDESIALARETGQTTDLAMSLAGLAWLQARMGHADECRSNAREALDLAGSHHITLAMLWAQFALGDLALAVGDANNAIDAYQAVQSVVARIDFRDVDVAPGPELAEAQLRAGEPSAAQGTAWEYLRLAVDKGQPWALSRGHRAVALVTDNAEERTAHFEKALELHQLSPDLFEEARTRLAFGATLRRDKRRVDARPQLRLALEAFERLGARPWADLSASELDATGERARRRGECDLVVLTPQEVRIAGMLAKGATTKEAAAALFLSPKTVEYHLRHIYQKLGIRSRAELSAAITAEPTV
jgi:DNA-binding CsgD family transcriptional regulator